MWAASFLGYKATGNRYCINIEVARDSQGVELPPVLWAISQAEREVSITTYATVT